MKKFLSHKIKIAFTLAFLVLLSGCDSQTTEKTQNYILPTGMEGCKVFRMNTPRGTDLYAVVCPNSTVTANYTVGKDHQNSVVTTTK